MPSHRRRIRLTERDSVYLTTVLFILAILVTATAPVTAPKPVEQVPSVLPVPMTGRNPYVAPTGPTPTPPPGR